MVRVYRCLTTHVTASMSKRTASTASEKATTKRTRADIANVKAETLARKAEKARHHAKQLAVLAERAENAAQAEAKLARRGMPLPPAIARPSAIDWLDAQRNLVLKDFINATDEDRFSLVREALTQSHVFNVLDHAAALCGCDSTKILVVSSRNGTRAGESMRVIDLYHHYNPRANEAWKMTGRALFSKRLMTWSIPEGLNNWELLAPVLGELFSFIIDADSMTVLRNIRGVLKDDVAGDPLLFVACKTPLTVELDAVSRGASWRYYVHTGRRFVPVAHGARIITTCSKVLLRESADEASPTLRLIDARTLKGPWHYLSSRAAHAMHGAYVDAWRRQNDECSVTICNPEDCIAGGTGASTKCAEVRKP